MSLKTAKSMLFSSHWTESNHYLLFCRSLQILAFWVGRTRLQTVVQRTLGGVVRGSGWSEGRECKGLLYPSLVSVNKSTSLWICFIY